MILKKENNCVNWKKNCTLDYKYFKLETTLAFCLLGNTKVKKIHEYIVKLISIYT